MWIPPFPTTCFSQPAYCLGMSVKILYRHLWIASQSSVIIFQWSVCSEHFVPFHTRSTAEGSLYFRELAAAVEGGFQRKDRRRFRTVSRLRIATRAFLLISSIFVTFSIPHLAPPPASLFDTCFCHLSVILWAQITETDTILDGTISLSFSFSVCWAPGATLYHKCQCFSAIVKHLQKPTKCQPRSSIATSVNCSHLEMSMSKPQCDGAGSWKSESAAPVL